MTRIEFISFDRGVSYQVTETSENIGPRIFGCTEESVVTKHGYNTPLGSRSQDQREFQAFERMGGRCPGVVTALGHAEVDGRMILLLERLGKGLDDVLADGAHDSVLRDLLARLILRDGLEAVVNMAERGCSHRDLHPGNFVLPREDVSLVGASTISRLPEWRLKLIDLNCAYLHLKDATNQVDHDSGYRTWGSAFVYPGPRLQQLVPVIADMVAVAACAHIVATGHLTPLILDGARVEYPHEGMKNPRAYQAQLQDAEDHSGDHKWAFRVADDIEKDLADCIARVLRWSGTLTTPTVGWEITTHTQAVEAYRSLKTDYPFLQANAFSDFDLSAPPRRDERLPASAPVRAAAPYMARLEDLRNQLSAKDRLKNKLGIRPTPQWLQGPRSSRPAATEADEHENPIDCRKSSEPLTRPAAATASSTDSPGRMTRQHRRSKGHWYWGMALASSGFLLALPGMVFDGNGPTDFRNPGLMGCAIIAGLFVLTVMIKVLRPGNRSGFISSGFPPALLFASGAVSSLAAMVWDYGFVADIPSGCGASYSLPASKQAMCFRIADGWTQPDTNAASLLGTGAAECVKASINTTQYSGTHRDPFMNLSSDHRFNTVQDWGPVRGLEDPRRSMWPVLRTTFGHNSWIEYRGHLKKGGDPARVYYLLSNTEFGSLDRRLDHGTQQLTVTLAAHGCQDSDVALDAAAAELLDRPIVKPISRVDSARIKTTKLATKEQISADDLSIPLGHSLGVFEDMGATREEVPDYLLFTRLYEGAVGDDSHGLWVILAANSDIDRSRPIKEFPGWFTQSNDIGNWNFADVTVNGKTVTVYIFTAKKTAVSKEGIDFLMREIRVKGNKVKGAS